MTNPTLEERDQPHLTLEGSRPVTLYAILAQVPAQVFNGERPLTPTDIARIVAGLDVDQRKEMLIEWMRLAPTLPKEKQWGFELELGEDWRRACTERDDLRTKLAEAESALADAVRERDGTGGVQWVDLLQATREWDNEIRHEWLNNDGGERVLAAEKNLRALVAKAVALATPAAKGEEKPAVGLCAKCDSPLTHFCPCGAHECCCCGAATLTRDEPAPEPRVTGGAEEPTCRHCGATLAGHYNRFGAGILVCVATGVQGERSFAAGPTYEQLQADVSRLTAELQAAKAKEAPEEEGA
jgi:hypothetical protein